VKSNQPLYILKVCAVLITLFVFGCAHISEQPSLEKRVGDQLINAAGESVKGADVFKTKYTLLYFSAHWCPPCKRFTPKFITFYNAYGEDRPFDVIFISSDKCEADMVTYMRETKMPWAAVPYNSALVKILREEFSYSGIPNLVLLDADGKVILNCYQGRRYLGPQRVLDALVKRVGSASAVKAKKGKKKVDLSRCFLSECKPCG